MPGSGPHFTAAEDAIVRALYPRGGYRAVALATGRKQSGISWRARRLGVPRLWLTEEEKRESARASRRRQRRSHPERFSARRKRRREKNTSAGRCRCGKELKARRRRCARCLRHAAKHSYYVRHGVRPTVVCARCEAWALPGSIACGRHQRAPNAAGDAERDRLRAMVRKARRAGHAVERRRCACGKHLVAAGKAVCRFCLKLAHPKLLLRIEPGVGL
jgi:hypothetical protein